MAPSYLDFPPRTHFQSPGVILAAMPYRRRPPPERGTLFQVSGIGKGRDLKEPKRTNRRILWMSKRQKKLDGLVIYSYKKDGAFKAVKREDIK